MAQFATIKKGKWRGQDVTGRFKVIRPYKESPSGAFITVEIEEDVAARVKCKFKDITLDGTPDATQGELVDKNVKDPDTVAIEEMVRANETEADAERRIAKGFQILNEMTKSAIAGSIRAAVVSGPPGIGKSHEVLELLASAKWPKRPGIGDDENYHIVKGMATPIALYKILYTYRHKNQVIVFDDCDSIFHDDVSLNLLKGALDTGKKRRIGWNSESRILKEDGIPNDFDFEGSVLFLTNIDFDHCRSKRLEPHMKALRSRCHYLDLTISSEKDIIRRIRQLSKTGLLDGYHLSEEVESEIVAFVEANVRDLDELSLRTVMKVADLAKSHPTGWREMAVHTVMRPEAKWRYLLAQQQASKPAAAKTK